MSITTITLPNGVRIETTSDDMSTFGALLAQPAPQQPKAATVATTTQPAPEPKARPKATKRTTEPKARPAKQPKAATSGKALWAEITTLIGNGDYVAAREAASVKPDTFGVQAEAAIARHMARTAKPSTTPKAAPQPKAEAPKAQPEPKARPMKDSPVLDKVQPEPAPKERRAAKRAAKQQAEAAAKRRPAHKPDCGCVTCPEGVAKRQAAKAQPKAEKATPQPKAEAKPKAKAPKVPQPTAIQVRDDAAEQREADRIVAKGVEQADRMLKHLDTDGLKEAIANYNALAKRNLRLGNERLAVAYDDALDSCSLALTLAKEQMASLTK